MLACRCDPEERHLGIMLREDGWKYAILALIDVEANYLVVKAYSYTTITSVQVSLYNRCTGKVVQPVYRLGSTIITSVQVSFLQPVYR